MQLFCRTVQGWSKNATCTRPWYETRSEIMFARITGAAIPSAWSSSQRFSMALPPGGEVVEMDDPAGVLPLVAVLPVSGIRAAVRRFMLRP
jgi:hypothetical protein